MPLTSLLALYRHSDVFHRMGYERLMLPMWVRHASCGSSRLPHCHESNRCMHICSHELQAIINLAGSERFQMQEHGCCSCHAWDENAHASMRRGHASKEVGSIRVKGGPNNGKETVSSVVHSGIVRHGPGETDNLHVKAADQIGFKDRARHIAWATSSPCGSGRS